MFCFSTSPRRSIRSPDAVRKIVLQLVLLLLGEIQDLHDLRPPPPLAGRKFCANAEVATARASAASAIRFTASSPCSCRLVVRHPRLPLAPRCGSPSARPTATASWMTVAVGAGRSCAATGTTSTIGTGCVLRRLHGLVHHRAAEEEGQDAAAATRQRARARWPYARCWASTRRMIGIRCRVQNVAGFSVWQAAASRSLRSRRS